MATPKFPSIRLHTISGSTPAELNVQLNLFFNLPEHKKFKLVDIIYSPMSWANNRVHSALPDDFWATVTILYTEK